MRVPILHDQREEFDERNLLLQATLGALSWAARLDAILERHAPAAGVPGAGPARPEDDALAAVLGVISLRLTLGRTLEAVPPFTSDAVPSPDSGHAADPRWLR